MGRPANERAAANIISPVGVRSLLTFVTDFSTFALECLPGAWERPPGLYFFFHIFILRRSKGTDPKTWTDSASIEDERTNDRRHTVWDMAL